MAEHNIAISQSSDFVVILALLTNKYVIHEIVSMCNMIILQCKCWPTFSWLKLLRLIVTTSYMHQLSNWTDFIITWFLLMLPVGIWLITQLVVCFVGLGHVSLYPFVQEFNLTWFLWLSIQWFTLWIDHSLPLKWNGNRLRVFTCLNEPISWRYQMTLLKEVL